MAEDIPCSSCSKPAAWAVTAPYDEGDPAGRLLAYCHPCRREHSDVAASIPLELVDEGEAVRTGLLEGSAGCSAPAMGVALPHTTSIGPARAIVVVCGGSPASVGIGVGFVCGGHW
ncbi:hypothetical protein BH23ACT5_BH23ACT5_12710 [soil metagenome]